MLNWYLQSGKDSDVVISSRIRLARNLKGIPYVNRYSKEDGKEVIEKVNKVVPKLGYGLRAMELKDIDDITKLSLVEKHIISPEFALNRRDYGMICINDDENICIMVNEEDHIRIQVLSSGLETENLLKLAVEIDKRLEQLLDYAYSSKYGFLTSCPTNSRNCIKSF